MNNLACEEIGADTGFGCGIVPFLKTKTTTAKALVLPSRFQVAPGSQDGGLVHQVLQVGPCEAGAAPGNLLEVHVGADGLPLAVDLQDLHPAFHIRPVHRDLPVKPPGTQEGRARRALLSAGLFSLKIGMAIAYNPFSCFPSRITGRKL